MAINNHNLAHLAQVEILEETLLALESIKSGESTLEETLEYFQTRKRLTENGVGKCPSCTLIERLEEKYDQLNSDI